MTTSSSFARLKDLAKENSSDRRRELLREVTESFFAADEPRTETENALFTDIFSNVAADLEVSARAELSKRVADAKQAPSALAKQLALDEISVAEPILRRSNALTEEDLIEVAQTRGNDHLMAVSKRENVSEAVSDVLVERGDDKVLSSLLSNNSAQISRESYETAVDRSQNNKELQTKLVRRKSMPLDLLNEMYFAVEQRLRNEILTRNDSVPPAALEAALKKARLKVAQDYGALPKDYEDSQRLIKQHKLRNSLNAPVLVQLLRDKKQTAFLIAFADMTGLDFDTARNLCEKGDMDGLAMACRAADFDRALFVTLAVLLCGKDRAMGAAQEFGGLYNDVPKEAAQRAMRFWRVRQNNKAAA